MRKQNRAVFHFTTLLLLVFGAPVSLGHETEWLKQFGTPGFDSGEAIARHSTGVYVTGHQASSSGFLRKYDFSGNEAWAREFPFGTSIAVDDSGVYVGGTASDASVHKFTHSGQPEWTHVFLELSDPGVSMGLVWAVAVHSTGVYVAGTSHAVCDDVGHCFSNALVSRLDLAGNELWVKIAGQPFDHPFGYREDSEANDIAVDATGVYVTGALGTADLRRYDFNGNLTRNFGTGTIWGAGVALDDSGSVHRGSPLPAAMSVRR